MIRKVDVRKKKEYDMMANERTKIYIKIVILHRNMNRTDDVDGQQSLHCSVRGG